MVTPTFHPGGLVRSKGPACGWRSIQDPLRGEARGGSELASRSSCFQGSLFRIPAASFSSSLRWGQ